MEVSTKRIKLLKRLYSVVQNSSVKQRAKILDEFKVKDIDELSEEQLQSAITKLSSSSDLWRKRVMASIGAYLKSVNKDSNADIIKAIACRATDYDDFNKIPISRLTDLYYGFNRKRKQAESVDAVCKQIDYDLAIRN